jgi:hypothetical protein
MDTGGQLDVPAAFPWRKIPGTHWIGGSVEIRVGMDAMDKRKISSTALNRILTPHGRTACSPDVIQAERNEGKI